MTEITTRAGKGAPLTHDEVDQNFLNLQETADAAYAASVAIGGKANASALGTSDDATNLGTTPGAILSDNGTAKGWFQELEAVTEVGGNFLQAGAGAVTRTGQDKARERVSVKDFGATGNGATDDTSAVLAAVAYIKSIGGGVVFFPRGIYKVTQTIFIDASYITLAGEGGAADGNVTYVGGMAAAIAGIASRILWAGSAGGTVVLFTPFPDDATQAALSGGGMMDIGVDGASIANDGIDLRSLRYAKFTNVSSMRCNSVNWKIGVANSNVLGGNKSIAFCEFRNITGSNSTIVGNTAKTMVLYGHITDGNVAINKFDNCGFYSASGVGSHIEVENSDSNTFVHCRWNGSLTLHATDTGSFSQGGDAVARHNVFLNNQGHIVAKAKIATPHTQGTNGFDSYGNVAYGYSRENGIAYPTIEAYADFQFHATGLGLTNKEGGIQLGHAPNITLMAKSADQSISTGTTTIVDWDAVSFDWLGCGNATTNRITAPNGCKWARLTYGVEWASDSTAGRFAGVRLNGSTLISKNQNSGYINSQEVISTQWFAVTPGDYYEMVVSQNTGGSLNLTGGSSTFLQAEWC